MGYSFEIKPASTVAATRFAIDRAYAVPVAADFDGTQAWRAKDIALLLLAREVPSSLARPLVVASVRPPARRATRAPATAAALGSTWRAAPCSAPRAGT